jgi:hypothetical protein
VKAEFGTTLALGNVHPLVGAVDGGLVAPALPAFVLIQVS